MSQKDEAYTAFENYIFPLKKNTIDKDDYLYKLAYGTVERFEAPDLLVKYGDELFIVEHFQIDSYPTTKKGSSLIRELCQTEHELEQKHADEEYAFDSVRRVDRNDKSSVKNYENTAIETFDKHYKKIDQYRKNVEDKKGKAAHSIIFFIESQDAPVACIYDTNTGQTMYRFILSYCETFLRHIKNFPDIEAVVVGYDSPRYVEAISQNRIDWMIDRCTSENIRIFETPHITIKGFHYGKFPGKGEG